MGYSKLIIIKIITTIIFFVDTAFCQDARVAKNDGLTINIEDEVSFGFPKLLVVRLTNSGKKRIKITQNELISISSNIYVVEKDTGKEWGNLSTIPFGKNRYRSTYSIVKNESITITMYPPPSSLFINGSIDKIIYFKHEMIKDIKYFRVYRKNLDEDYKLVRIEEEQ